MDVTLAGKVSSVRPVQPEKAFLPMDTLPVSQKERLVRAVQFWKAPSSMLVAPAIGAAVRLLQRLNALPPMVVRESASVNVNVSRLEQP